MASIERGAGKGDGEESVEEDIKMENVRTTYDLFVQNQLTRTSHTLEWLNVGHEDPDNKVFNYEYFLIGTHRDQEVEDKEYLQLVRMRVPNQSLNAD